MKLDIHVHYRGSVTECIFAMHLFRLAHIEMHQFVMLIFSSRTDFTGPIVALKCVNSTISVNQPFIF